jgi:hypothetical protein
MVEEGKVGTTEQKYLSISLADVSTPLQHGKYILEHARIGALAEPIKFISPTPLPEGAISLGEAVRVHSDRLANLLALPDKMLPTSTSTATEVEVALNKAFGKAYPQDVVGKPYCDGRATQDKVDLDEKARQLREHIGIDISTSETGRYDGKVPQQCNGPRSMEGSSGSTSRPEEIIEPAGFRDCEHGVSMQYHCSKCEGDPR